MTRFNEHGKYLIDFERKYNFSTQVISEDQELKTTEK